jgi:hydrogenase maturation factor HypF (carbamoyltransferase family)
LLYPYYDQEEILDLMKTHYLDYFPHGVKEVEIVANQLERNFNLTESTSTGRVLDALAVSLHICGERTYEGECAMKLESAAYPGEDLFDLPIQMVKHEGRTVLDTSPILMSVVEKNWKEHLSKTWHALLRELFPRVWLNWPSALLIKKVLILLVVQEGFSTMKPLV